MQVELGAAIIGVVGALAAAVIAVTSSKSIKEVFPAIAGILAVTAGVIWLVLRDVQGPGSHKEERESSTSAASTGIITEQQPAPTDKATGGKGPVLGSRPPPPLTPPPSVGTPPSTPILVTTPVLPFPTESLQGVPPPPPTAPIGTPQVDAPRADVPSAPRPCVVQARVWNNDAPVSVQVNGQVAFRADQGLATTRELTLRPGQNRIVFAYDTNRAANGFRYKLSVQDIAREPSCSRLGQSADDCQKLAKTNVTWACP